MDYSIIIPVFNKAELTRNCLAKLRPSLEGAGEGEIIVVDNASTDHTASVLSEFPWIRLIRNETNRGFAGANNQGAQAARGRVLVLLNNDTEPITKWLEPMMRAFDDPSVGIAGAKLLFEKGTIQHAGVAIRWRPYIGTGMQPYHFLAGEDGNVPVSNEHREYQAVTGACLATPRDLYLELGGLDEAYWNGSEDLDYCFKVRARGLRVVYEPRAQLFHFESQSGSQRFRRMQANMQLFADRWREDVQFDSSRRWIDVGVVELFRRFSNGGEMPQLHRAPPVDVLVHGITNEFDRGAFEARVRANRTRVANLVWCRENDDAVARARSMMELRGERYVAFVRADSVLEDGWLDELYARVTTPTSGTAATFADGVREGTHIPLVGSDARCVLLRLRQLPQDVTLGDFDSLDDAVADLTVRALQMDRATVGVRALAALGPTRHPQLSDPSPGAIERVLRSRPQFERGLVSIVTLSWNAPEFTVKALESIRQHTAEPYEVIIVDNGSGPETLKVLATIDDPHVKIVYNKTNRGFAGGNNDGIAHARGDYVIVLNNDVIVTPGWADGLVDAFRRIPGLGISAPRSNNVAGDQQLGDIRYTDESEMQAFALERRRVFAEKGYITDRAIGFCWCISRTVLDQIGALDERYVLGNFEDDDYCMRVRAAGYWIYVCDDVFIHHFGSRSFAANKVDYRTTMSQNWERFAKKWGFSGPLPTAGYVGTEAHARGFKRDDHYLPFPGARAVAPSPADTGAETAALAQARAVFGIAVRDEADWSDAAQFVRRFALAFKLEDAAQLAIGVFGELDATTIGSRVERILERAGVNEQTSGDIVIADYDEDDAEWLSQTRDPRWVDIASLKDRSPSALRRLLGAPVR